MSTEAASAIGSLEKPAYARFSRRLRALFIDLVVMWIVMFGALFVAVQFESAHVARVLGFTVIAFLLLYEPILVSLTGSSIGHYMSNLRVVDNQSGGNVSFAKAVVRVIIKDILGIYSFVTMATTLRHQAVHDYLTDSTVQARDAARSDPDDFVEERTELFHPAMPSRLRRLVVVSLYEIVLFALLTLAIGFLESAELVSPRCLSGDICTGSENAVLTALSFALLAVGVLIVILGWRGRLPGCRAKFST